MIGRNKLRGVSSMMLLVGVFAVALAGGILYFHSGSPSTNTAGYVVTQQPGTTSGKMAMNIQDVSLKASGNGYDKSEIDVKAGNPVHLSFSADSSAGCGTTLIIDGLGVNLASNNDQVVTANFTPSKGTYVYHCPAGILTPGKLVAS